MLKEFSIENYRAFARSQRIEIRPLTLFFGWNSGGKSALIRFLPLLSESLQVGGPPIWLSGDVGRRSTWPDLVSKSTQRGVLRFSLSWNSPDEFSSSFEIEGDLDGRWQEANKCTIFYNGIHTAFDRYNLNGVEWSGLIPETNLFPDTPLNLLAKKLSELKADVQWISGVRQRPPRVATYGGGAPSQLSSDGADALDHLIAAQLRSTNDPLLELTREFFLTLGQQLELDSPSLGAWRVMLRPTGGASNSVNLCDTGEGYAQVLPVLVALARAQLNGPKILCLEQPELHLHTRAQAQLAKVLVNVAKTSQQANLLVETHSEVLLTSVQLAIAKKEISAEKVRVYWVESRPDGTSDVVPVDFDEHGSPRNSALLSAFNEVTELGQALLKQQLASLT